jgi:hypothetical protein
MRIGMTSWEADILTAAGNVHLVGLDGTMVLTRQPLPVIMRICIISVIGLEAACGSLRIFPNPNLSVLFIKQDVQFVAFRPTLSTQYT